MNRSLRVLVTGATGFLGSTLLAALKAESTVVPVAACRDRHKLPPSYHGEVREGDLLEPAYRREVVRGIDIVCHAGTWASMWNHGELEREHFYKPALDLIEQSITQGVKRFIQPSTVAIAATTLTGRPLDDFAPTQHTGFWPHLDRLIDLDRHMQANAQRGTQMVSLRLGHFVGAGNRVGLVPALVPRLKTRLVPWLAGGRARLPLVSASDLGRAFAQAAMAQTLDDYESFNICGAEFPALREVIEFIAHETGCPKPYYSVPFSIGYGFGGLMEWLHPILPGSSPFLTRSIVHLCEDRVCTSTYAQEKLGYTPHQDWRVAVRDQLAELRVRGFPWPLLATDGSMHH